MLFTTLTGPSYEKAHRQLAAALKRGVDGVEIRLDTFAELNLSQIRKLCSDATPIKTLFTLRSASQGGGYQDSEESRLEWIEKLCSLHPDMIDLEHTVDSEFCKKIARLYPHIQLVKSYHNFQSTPSDLDALVASLRSPTTHIIKIAAMANTSLDVLRMMQCVWDHSPREFLIGISMGEHGRPTRCLGPVMGNTLDYACLEQIEQTAPGQLSLDELLEVYHYRSLNRTTALFALLGSPVNKSLGSLIHNAVFKSLGIHASYVHFETTPLQIGEVLESVRTLPFAGFSVTMPLKEAVIPYLDEMSARAKQIGAVNTIVVRKGKLIGHNTDGSGALNAIEQHLDVRGKTLVIIGSGGAARALAHEATDRKARVIVLNRTRWKAEKLAQELHCQGGGLEDLAKIYAQGYEIIVNCTPEAEPVSPQLILPECHAMDLTYVPKMTPFLHQAALKNCHLIYGSEMFVQQAIEQQLIWFQRLNDRANIQEIIEKAIPYLKQAL